MSATRRIGLVAIAGAILYFAGIVNSMVIYEPSAPGSVVVVVAMTVSLGLIAIALWRTREPGSPRVDRASRWAWRLGWSFVAVMALVSLAWLYTVPRQRGFDWTPYHNDAIAINECAAQTILAGGRPYSSLDLFGCYRQRALGPDRTTPLRRGAFADIPVYPSDDQLDAMWDRRAAGDGENVEFVWRPSYPALSFLAILPWVALGWDTNFLYTLCLFAAMALVVVRGSPSLRPWLITGLLGATSLVAFTVGGSADHQDAQPLTAAWLWRERRWSAVAIGLAVATKQLAWFFCPFLLLQWVAVAGPRESARRVALAVAVFAVANAPLALPDPQGWVAGVLTPVAEPMFPRGAGLVFLGVNGVGPILPNVAYLALEVAAYGAGLIVAWRERHRSPELGTFLAVAPLFLAHRSLFSYFFLLPLFAIAGLARLRRAEEPERVVEEGGLTLFAVPRSGR